MTNDLQIISCDFNDAIHCENVIKLLDAYMKDEMGNMAPMPDDAKANLVNGLSQHPSLFVLLVKYENKFIGLATSFIGYSTFQGKKLINIHDIIILKEYRGKGIGRKLMMAIEKKARQMDCCKITLEVRKDNNIAQELYKSEGFQEGNPPMLFWQKQIC